MRGLATKLYQRVTNFGLAFMLAVSSFAVAGPFILSQVANAAGTVHTTDLSTWNLSETLATGHNELVANGLHVWTEGATSTDKAAGYIQTPGLNLDDVDSTAINFDSYTGGRPSVQLVVDRDDDGFPDGILVYEPWAYPPGDTYWTNGVGFGVPAGLGYASYGTLAEYQTANPGAKILAIGYSLGSGVLGDAVISSIEIDDTSYTFGLPVDTQRPQLSNISISPTINGNIGGLVTVYFDLVDATGVDLTKTKVLFADGPNTSNAKRESTKFSPVHISGDSYKVEINTLDFVKANWTGVYNLAFNLYDTLGNHGSSKPAAFRSILIDNSGPTSVLQSPTSGAIINGTQRFVFDVSDHTGVASGYMKFQENSTQYTLVNGGAGEWYADVDTSLLADGDYTIDARFVDSFGKARYGANKGTVTVDSLAPHVEITNPVGSLFNTNVQVRGTVSDLHPRHYWINVTLDGVTVLNKTVIATSFTDEVLYNATHSGDYVVTLAARDAAGGTATSGNRSLNVTKSFTIDKIAPVAPENLVWTPAGSSAITSGSFTNIENGTASWGSVADADHYVYHYWNDISTSVYNVGNPYVVPSVGGIALPGVFNQGEGKHYFAVAAVDAAGNQSDFSAAFEVVFDETAPTIPVITAPLGGYFNSSPILNQWDASSDDTSGVLGYQIAYQYDDGHTFGGANSCAGETAASLGIGVDGKFIGCRDVTSTQRNHDPGINEQGGVTIWVRAQDKAGNWSEWSNSVHYYYDATAPVITILGDIPATVEAGDTYTDAGATAFDEIEGDLTSSIVVDDSLVDANTVGSYTVTYTVTDSAGNTSSAARTVNVVDTTAPVVTIDALTTTDTTPTLTGTVDDPTAEVVVNINGVDYTATNNGDGTWTVTIASLPIGTYTATVTATDTESNANVSTAEVTVEEVPTEETEGETVVQTIITPAPDQDVLGDQDDQTETEGNTDEQGSSDVQAATDDKTGETYGANILGLAWYWWLLILAAIVAAWWLIAGYLRRKSQES